MAVLVSQILQAADRQHLAVLEQDNEVGQDLALQLIVGGENDGLAAISDVSQDIPDFPPRSRRHAARGLVQYEDLIVGNQGQGDF